MLRKQLSFLGFVAIVYCVPMLDLFPFPQPLEANQPARSEIQIPQFVDDECPVEASTEEIEII